MPQMTGPHTRYDPITYAPIKPRRTISAALTLACTSYIPPLGVLAIPALILAVAADGKREHPITRDRAHRAQVVAIISIAFQIVLTLALLGLGVIPYLQEQVS